jgi:hypothetical protein
MQMTFVESLRSHKGGLIRLKTELFWYNNTEWDGTLFRICLLLDARDYGRPACWKACTANATTTRTAVSHLLIDGLACWVLMDEQDVAILNETR